MTPRQAAASMRAASHRLMASVFRLDEAADRIEMGAAYVSGEDRALWHERMAIYYRARAAGKSCEEAEDESEKLGEGAATLVGPLRADGAVIEPGGEAGHGVPPALGSQG